MLNNRLNSILIILCLPALILTAYQVKLQNSRFQICSKEWEVKRRFSPAKHTHHFHVVIILIYSKTYSLNTVDRQRKS